MQESFFPVQLEYAGSDTPAGYGLSLPDTVPFLNGSSPSESVHCWMFMAAQMVDVVVASVVGGWEDWGLVWLW